MSENSSKVFSTVPLFFICQWTPSDHSNISAVPQYKTVLIHQSHSLLYLISNWQRSTLTVFKRLGLYLPTSIPLPSKADLTDRLDTIFSSFINTVQQSHISVPVVLLGEHHLLLETLTVLLHNLQICSCKSLTFCNCTRSA